MVEEPRLPDQLARRGVEGEEVVVVGGVDDQAAVDRDVAVGLVLRDVAPVLPPQVAGDRVDRLDDVVGVRHVQRAAVGDRRAVLRALRQGPRPDHAQAVDVAAVDLVERTVAPAVERPPPRQPVAVRRAPEHGVGDRDEVRFRGGPCGCRFRGRRRQGENERPENGGRGEGEHDDPGGGRHAHGGSSFGNARILGRYVITICRRQRRRAEAAHAAVGAGPPGVTAGRGEARSVVTCG